MLAHDLKKNKRTKTKMSNSKAKTLKTDLHFLKLYFACVLFVCLLALVFACFYCYFHFDMESYSVAQAGLQHIRSPTLTS